MTNLMDRNDTFVTVHNKCSEIPPPTSTYLATPLQRSDSNSSISVTIQNQAYLHIKILFPQRPILSPPTILNFPPVHPVFISIVQKGIVPIIRLLQQSTLFMFANSYHSSHNVIFTLLMNIMDQLNYIKPSKFSDSECF